MIDLPGEGINNLPISQMETEKLSEICTEAHIAGSSLHDVSYIHLAHRLRDTPIPCPPATS